MQRRRLAMDYLSCPYYPAAVDLADADVAAAVVMYGHYRRAAIGSHVAAAEDLVDGVAAARLWVDALDIDGDLTADGAALVAAAIDAAVHRATGHHDSHILTTGSLVGATEDIAGHMATS